MKHIITTAAVAMLALAGCGDGDTDGAAETAMASPTPTGPPQPERQDSVFDLRTAVESSGYACSGWEVIAEPIDAIERATCTDQVVVSIHTDASQAQAAIENTAEIVTSMLDEDSVHLTGPNWSINCGSDLDLCEQFADVLGGEVQVLTPEDVDD